MHPPTKASEQRKEKVLAQIKKQDEYAEKLRRNRPTVPSKPVESTAAVPKKKPKLLFIILVSPKNPNTIISILAPNNL